VGCYSLLNYGYFKIPVELFMNVIYYHGVVTICADLINWIGPKEQVWAQQNHVLSSKADLEIVRGCDGAGVLFLMVSAIIVFPSTWRRKLLGLILGICLVYSLNLLRVSGLYFVIAYHADWFLLIHTYLAPTLMIILGCSYFAWWAFGSTNKGYDQA
jgi:exosortase family protein XrtM